MTLDALIMLSGAFVAVLPFLGFPNSWDNILFFLAGVFIIALGIVVRRYPSSSPLTKSGSGAPSANGTAQTPEHTGETSNESLPHG